MSFYTCPRCHYTFSSAQAPTACPDCGHRAPVPSTDIEYDRFYWSKLNRLWALHAPDMSRDERNWARVLLCLNRPKATSFTTSFLRDHILDATPEIALDTYKGLRWEFIRSITADRETLSAAGVAEPRFLLRDDDGLPVITDWELYGKALQTLYAFETEDRHAVPGIDCVQAINLERITDNPSDAYIAFLRSWLGIVADTTRLRLVDS